MKKKKQIDAEKEAGVAFRSEDHETQSEDQEVEEADLKRARDDY